MHLAISSLLNSPSSGSLRCAEPTTGHHIAALLCHEFNPHLDSGMEIESNIFIGPGNGMRAGLGRFSQTMNRHRPGGGGGGIAAVLWGE